MAVGPWVAACALLCAAAAAAAAAADSNETRDFCPELQWQKNFDLDELMRMWYVVEVLEHRQPGGAAISRIDSCPVVQLQRLGETRLKLLWEEPAGVVEYHFRLPIAYTPGYWVAEGSPNSTLADHHGKRIAVHFSGDVHVMKAVYSHLVLTFCSAAEEKLWTIVLSPESSLSAVELRGVNKMLERRGLTLSNVRQTCGGAGSAPASAALASLLLAAGVAALAA
ncbi:uncharacterized protein LOC134531934 [Bacillus rossius redtenbacheri]|uniref:uncharacterized protein LOC134531934 n=1 Tax=Bacillus rossius redtenbacheri TaxID=93214 RepID=UPI002FDDA2E0